MKTLEIKCNTFNNYVLIHSYHYIFLYYIIHVVPSPQVLITTSPSMEPLYESTALNITCLVDIPEVVIAPYSTSFSWINPSGNRISSTNDGRVTVYPSESVRDNMYQSILVFSPVDNGDNGEFNDMGIYTCQITISTANNNDLILGTTDNTTREILITGKYIIIV